VNLKFVGGDGRAEIVGHAASSAQKFVRRTAVPDHLLAPFRFRAILGEVGVVDQAFRVARVLRKCGDADAGVDLAGERFTRQRLGESDARQTCFAASANTRGPSPIAWLPNRTAAGARRSSASRRATSNTKPALSVQCPAPTTKSRFAQAHMANQARQSTL